QQPVAALIKDAYPSTLLLTFASLMVALVLAIPAGVRSARRRNRWDDRLLSFVSLLGLSFPNFALGPILILFFAIQLGLLPVSGTALCQSPVAGITSFCRPSPWAARSQPSSRAWCAPRCSKSSARITSGQRAPRDWMSAPSSTSTRCATR